MSQTPSLKQTMLDMGKRAKAASLVLNQMTAEDRTRGLNAMAQGIRAAKNAILTANAADMEIGKAKALSPSLMDRLSLSPQRVEAMAAGVDAIAKLDDPIGKELARWSVPTGLDIARVSGPMGVIGIIYESRPNVTADAGALCLRSANAAILRCGSESLNASTAIVTAMRAALADAGLPQDAVQLVETTDRAAVGEILTGLGGTISVVVPRGGKGLVGRVQQDARVPVIGHLEGLCHTYVDASADLDKAEAIVVNAKMRRTGICGSLETLLIDASIAQTALPRLADSLRAAGCELRGDAAAMAIYPALTLATEEDFQTEYLAPIASIAIVDGVDGASDHIARYSSGHTEAIIAEDPATAEHFLAVVDSAIVMHNASTQFADGGEFGMGAEIGIATSRIHARGPVGADQLTIFKYVVRGNGQTRA